MPAMDLAERKHPDAARFARPQTLQGKRLRQLVTYTGNRKMRARVMDNLRRIAGWCRLNLRLAWGRATNTESLTLMIAAGTLATAAVAYLNGRSTQEQVRLLRQQVEFNSTETRPFLRLKPSISPEKPLRVILKVIDVGPIPGRVIGYDMLVQVGHRVVEPKGLILNTGDILYPDQPGMGVYVPLPEDEFRAFAKGAVPVVAGGCVVYSSITADDTRRWRVSAAYHFDSVDELPVGLFVREVPVSTNTDSCDASTLRSEWASQLKLSPR